MCSSRRRRQRGRRGIVSIRDCLRSGVETSHQVVARAGHAREQVVPVSSMPCATRNALKCRSSSSSCRHYRNWHISLFVARARERSASECGDMEGLMLCQQCDALSTRSHMCCSVATRGAASRDTDACNSKRKTNQHDAIARVHIVERSSCRSWSTRRTYQLGVRVVT